MSPSPRLIARFVAPALALALALVIVIVIVIPGAAPADPAPAVVHQSVGTGGAVASPHPLATEAGLAVLRKGGNAIDAAVAVALTLGVVDGHNSGLGGGCLFLARLPSGEILALDGREMAPAAAHRDVYLLPDGSADTVASKTGSRAPGVPGSLAVYQQVLAQHGTTSLASHLETAAALAEGGFPINATFAARLTKEKEALRRFAGPDSPFFTPDGAPLPTGATLVQSDLAATYRSLANEGIAWFYGGPYAERCAAWMAENNGLLTREDFANYKVRTREPIRTTYRDHEIIGFPPPSSGGTHVAQILNILECFDLPAMEEADRTHLIAEACKLAFADRAHWLGDSDHAVVPVAGLVSKTYAKSLTAKIDLENASPVAGHGDPEAPPERHTAHFTIVDEDGCWVACTATLNTSFGSKVSIPGTGLILNNQMDDFSIKPGVPNAFGLVGAEANAVGPGKRPLSSMSPTLVLRDNEPVLTVGAAGGPTVITQALLAIVRTIDLDKPLLEALGDPRFHHQWKPNRIQVEAKFTNELRAELKRRGHTLSSRSTFGASQAIARDPETGSLKAVSDPRGLGSAGTVK